MGSAQVELDLPALAVALGQKVHVDLVGAELRATMADLCKIEGFCVVLRTADAKNRMPVMLVAAHEEVNRFGELRASDQTENGVHVALTGSTGPELEPLYGRLLSSFFLRRNSRPGRSNSRQLDNTRTHLQNILTAPALHCRYRRTVVNVRCIFSRSWAVSQTFDGAEKVSFGLEGNSRLLVFH